MRDTANGVCRSTKGFGHHEARASKKHPKTAHFKYSSWISLLSTIWCVYELRQRVVHNDRHHIRSRSAPIVTIHEQVHIAQWTRLIVTLRHGKTINAKVVPPTAVYVFGVRVQNAPAIRLSLAALIARGVTRRRFQRITRHLFSFEARQLDVTGGGVTR